MVKPVVEGSLESPPFEKPSIEQVNNQHVGLFGGGRFFWFGGILGVLFVCGFVFSFFFFFFFVNIGTVYENFAL